MVGSTPGSSNHGTCMPYVNVECNVSLVHPLLVRSHDSGDTVCCIFMLDVKWSTITMWLTVGEFIAQSQLGGPFVGQEPRSDRHSVLHFSCLT
jgi:hypothetical protein